MIAEHEQALSTRLLDFLKDLPGVRVIGEETADKTVRVPIISFVVEGMESSDVVIRTDAHQVAIRFGHFYSARLIEHLGLDVNEGVVRVSMVHYNTLEEVDRLTAALQEILPGVR